MWKLISKYCHVNNTYYQLINPKIENGTENQLIRRSCSEMFEYAEATFKSTD